MEPGECDAYCPKNILLRLEGLGFQYHEAATRYGKVAFYHRRCTDSRLATLLIHGVASDATTWSPMLQCAGELNLDLGNVLMVDLPGFGRSENRLDTLWIPEVGAMLMAETEKLGFDRLRLAGHSMGGFLALDMAARFQTRINSAHIAAGSYFGILNTIKRPFSNVFHNPGPAVLWNAYYALSLAGPVGTAIVKTLAALVGRSAVLTPFVANPKKLKEQVARVLLSQLNPRGVVLTARNGPKYDAAEVWSQIKVPLTVVFARRDRMVTARDADEMDKVNPLARIRWVEDAGHMLIVERPSAVLRALDL